MSYRGVAQKRDASACDAQSRSDPAERARTRARTRTRTRARAMRLFDILLVPQNATTMMYNGLPRVSENCAF